MAPPREGAGSRTEQIYANTVPAVADGKGVMPDDHPLSVAVARTLALQNADVVFLMGARFNWIFHFGQPPRYAKHMRGDRAIEQSLGRPPVVSSEERAVAPDDRPEGGRERGDLAGAP
jgi:hypothetical protein